VNAITRVVYSNDSFCLMVEVITHIFEQSGHPSFVFSTVGERSKIYMTIDLHYTNVASHSMDLTFTAFHYPSKERYWLNEWREFAKTSFTTLQVSSPRVLVDAVEACLLAAARIAQIIPSFTWLGW